MFSLVSNSMYMMERSLDFLWAKQAAHMDNIANAETPGYKAKTVRFEETFEKKLRAAAQKARSRAGMTGRMGTADLRQAISEVSWRVDEDEETTRMDENGVNVLEQNVEAVRTAYQIQYVMQAISSNLTMLNNVVRGT